MYHNINDSILKRNLYEDNLEPGRYYVLVSDLYICCFTHVLHQHGGSYEADTLYVHYSPKQYFFHTFYGAYVKVERITATAFERALQLYEQCKREILSLQFTKERLTGIDKTCQYYYLTNAAGNLIFFGNLVTDNDEEKMVVVGIDTNKDMVATNLKPVSDFDENLLWYRIDAKTYGKAKKMHDMIDHTLATMLLSYLKRG